MTPSFGVFVESLKCIQQTLFGVRSRLQTHGTLYSIPSVLQMGRDSPAVAAPESSHMLDTRGGPASVGQ